VPGLGERGLTAFAFPPAPEKVPGHDHIARLAESRDDDLIFAGTRESIDPALLMALVGEVVAEYSVRYEKWTASTEQPALDKAGERPNGGEIDEVVYALLSEADRLNELTKLVGRLRYATEGGDSTTVDEADSHIRGLAKQMPANRRVDRLLAAAHSKSSEGARLAQLYLERAYCLYREDYLRVKALDADIAALEPRLT
jgi:hypothetical protein